MLAFPDSHGHPFNPPNGHIQAEDEHHTAPLYQPSTCAIARRHCKMLTFDCVYSSQERLTTMTRHAPRTRDTRFIDRGEASARLRTAGSGLRPFSLR